MAWGDSGVTQLLQLQETTIPIPASGQGSVTRTLQRAGLLRRLRFLYSAVIERTAVVGEDNLGRSDYGPVGGGIARISVEANGQIPLVNVSGLGASVYNEIQNRDGSVLYDATHTVVDAEINGFVPPPAKSLYQYPSVSTVGTHEARQPFEFQFSLPVALRGQISELGLWLLQNQAIDVGVNVTFNPVYAPTSTDNASGVWTGGTIPSEFTADLANTKLELERELYEIPADPKNLPNLAWAHQVIEYQQPFTGGFSRFDIPRSGLLLRAIVINVDSNTNLLDYDTVKSLSWIYGANETPVTRAGHWLVNEYLMDYHRYPPKGVLSLDFYKWGWEGVKLVKDTEVLANLRLETQFANTAQTGTQRIILDRLYPVLTTR